MNTTLKVIRYSFFDLLTSRWLIIYTLFFLAITSGLFYFGEDASQAVLSVLNFLLLVIPLVSLVLGLSYYYYTRDFVELMLTQPISRRNVFFGHYLGIALPLAGAFILGTGIPFLASALPNKTDIPVIVSLTVAGTLISLVFSSLAFWIGLSNQERVRGLGIALGVWLLFTIIYDALLLLFIILMQQYPIDQIPIGLSMLNPIDLSRILVLLQLDTAALMGYTVAVFRQFLGSGLGLTLSSVALVMWIILPAFLP
jgi:Cu-processing system permease protein